MNQPAIYNPDYYNASFDPHDENLGVAFVAPLIAAAPSIFQTVMGLFGGGRKAQFQGLAEINAAGQQATQAILEAAQLSGRDVEILCANGDGDQVERHRISTLIPHGFGPANLADAG